MELNETGDANLYKKGNPLEESPFGVEPISRDKITTVMSDNPLAHLSLNQQEGVEFPENCFQQLQEHITHEYYKKPEKPGQKVRFYDYEYGAVVNALNEWTKIAAHIVKNMNPEQKEQLRCMLFAGTHNSIKYGGLIRSNTLKINTKKNKSLEQKEIKAETLGHRMEAIAKLIDVEQYKEHSSFGLLENNPLQYCVQYKNTKNVLDVNHILSVVVYALIEALGTTDRPNRLYTFIKQNGRYWDENLLAHTQTLSAYWKTYMIWYHQQDEATQEEIDTDILGIRLTCEKHNLNRAERKKASDAVVKFCNKWKLSNPFTGEHGNIAESRFELRFGVLALFGEWHGMGVDKM